MSDAKDMARQLWRVLRRRPTSEQPQTVCWSGSEIDAQYAARVLNVAARVTASHDIYWYERYERSLPLDTEADKG